MSEIAPMPAGELRCALADSIDFLNPDHWDQVAAHSGLFLSRPFLSGQSQWSWHKASRSGSLTCQPGASPS
jgi:hypothetical protein